MAVKAGQRLADVIEARILNGGLAAGTNLGSETELIAHYGVSRPVFREAVRLVEHDGLAVMRKGPSGGLIVAEPSHSAATHATAVWLRRNGADLEELFATRELLEPACALRAAERVGPETRGRLLEVLDDQHRLGTGGDFPAYNVCALRFHQVIAELCGNRVCWLFLQTLAELTMHFGGASAYSLHELEETEHAHQQIADAVIAGDGPLASYRMLVHMRATRHFSETLTPRGRPPQRAPVRP